MSETPKHNAAVVYVITRGEAYEGATVDGVFDNIDAARACVQQLMEQTAPVAGRMWLPVPTTPNHWRRGYDYIEITTWPLHHTIQEYDKQFISTE